MYNLTVDTAHIFFVGKGQWLVHNSNTGCPIWSSTKNKTAEQNAQSHWNSHSAEFPEFKDAQEYIDAAQDFAASPPLGTLKKRRNSGEVVMYDPKTNTFMATLPDGTPKTMFRPTGGMTYWQKQLQDIQNGK